MKLDKSKKLEIYTRYTKGERLKDLAKEHSVSLGTLTNWYYKYGFKIDLFKNQPKSKYNINDQFLEIIDTEQKAYFLGLMLSDGYVTGTNKVSVKLHKQDKELLDNIFSYITERPVIIRENTCEITICSKKLFQDLEKQGCIRNKTYSQMKLPVLKRELYSHFIRGYFDGDGSIYFSKSTTTNKYGTKYFYNNLRCQIIADQSFANVIKNLFASLGISSTLAKSKSDHMKYVTVSGGKNLRLLHAYLYNNANVFLARKKEIFDQVFSPRGARSLR